MKGSARFLLPLGGFVILAGLLAWGLGQDPKLIPSPLIGKPVPKFRLPTLQDPQRTLDQSIFQGKVALLNVWATWCVSCRQEHAFLDRLARRGEVTLYALDYKDERPDALNWLRRLGNPYEEVLFDADGRVGIDWGVYGTPETFVVDREGIIRYKYVGPLDERSWAEKVEPVVQRLKAES